MKKTVYMLFLLISAIVLGGLTGKAVTTGPLSFLSYSRSFQFMRDGALIDTSVFKLNFGFYISGNVAQLLFVGLAIFIYYKTAPKLIAGK